MHCMSFDSSEVFIHVLIICLKIGDTNHVTVRVDLTGVAGRNARLILAEKSSFNFLLI